MQQAGGSGWVGQAGPVCTIDLWITLLDLVDSITATVRWQVPSHTDILGNERANVLAEEGRVRSPYHVLRVPDRPVINLELRSTPTPRRAPAVPRSLEISDIIAPSRDMPAFCRPAETESYRMEMERVSNCLDFSDHILSQNLPNANSLQNKVAPLIPVLLLTQHLQSA